MGAAAVKREVDPNRKSTLEISIRSFITKREVCSWLMVFGVFMANGVFSIVRVQLEHKRDMEAICRTRV